MTLFFLPECSLPLCEIPSTGLAFRPWPVTRIPLAEAPTES